MFIRRSNLLLFLTAAFSMTQIRIVGYLGISELLMTVAGPFVLFKNWKFLKRDGFGPILLLSGLWVVSALITDWYRQTEWSSLLKGMASPLMVLMMIPCLHAMLRDDIRLVKWAIVGFTVTVFLSTYVIPSGTTAAVAEMQGITAREAALDYKLTFMSMVMSVFSLVPQLYYLRFPMLSLVITLGLAVFGLLEGGRSAFLALMMSAGLMLVGGGSAMRIRKVSRMIPLMFLSLVILSMGAKILYEEAAKRELMGEGERDKFEEQSASKLGLLSGRSQFVPIALAIKDSPLIGHGSWAIDYKGYAIRAAEWMEDDKTLSILYRKGGVGYIPGHSHILVAYLWHGILGAVFWVYVLWILWRTFRHNLGVVPELYGYLVLSLPPLIWAIFFSPFGGRVSTVTVLVVCLLVKRLNEPQWISRAKGVEMQTSIK